VRVDLIAGNINNPPSQTQQTNGAGQYNFSGLSNGAYYVKVWGPDNTYVPWTASQVTVSGANVTHDHYIPKLVTPISPAPGQTNVSQQPLLTWNAITEATRYTIQINRQSDFAPYDVGAQSFTNSYSVQQVLDPGTTFIWQIDGYDAGGRWVGASQGGWTFVTVGPLFD
jgi:hypothetical protein